MVRWRAIIHWYVYSENSIIKVIVRDDRPLSLPLVSPSLLIYLLNHPTTLNQNFQLNGISKVLHTSIILVCTVRSALCTLHCVLCPLHPIPGTLHSALFTVCSAPCTLHSALCTVCNTPCILHLCTPWWRCLFQQ